MSGQSGSGYKAAGERAPAGEDGGGLARHALPPRSAVRGRRERLVGRAADILLDLRALALGNGRALDAAASLDQVHRVAVLGVYAPDGSRSMERAAAQLRSSRHQVELTLGALGGISPALVADTALDHMEGGKLGNLNRLAGLIDPLAADWILVIDDDVDLPRGFLDRFLHVAGAHRLTLCQPALRRSSHTAYEVTRRRASIVRITRFVEIGPVVLMSRDAWRALTPFPEQGMGWGVDAHWGAVARERGWRLGVVDATPVRHERRPTGSTYAHAEAVAAAEAFLARNPHLTWQEAEEVLATHDRIEVR